MIKTLIGFTLPYQDFVDLCSVSNVSLLVLDQEFCGYYIHGKAPWDESDVPLSKLKEQLDSEEQGFGKKRGLTKRDNSITSYEIYLPKSLRSEYDIVLSQRGDLLKLHKELKKEHEQKKKQEEQKMKSELKAQGIQDSNIDKAYYEA